MLTILTSSILKPNQPQWVKNPTSLSEISPAFVLPPDMRPDLSQVSTLASIPIIDLKEGSEGEGLFAPSLVEKVSRACEEYGFFQIINHGVQEELCTRMLDAMKHLFEMPPHVKADLFSEDPTKEVRLYSHHLKVPPQDMVSMWIEAFLHPWHPSHDFTALFPSTTPSIYRAVIGEYSMEINKLFSRLLSLISLGLGLDKDCVERRHGQNPTRKAQANYYPPCPEPELALGLEPHTDFNTLTILQQSDQVSGLQVMKDERWVSVDPVPKSFVVNVGDQLQVLSNGRYKSVHHRAVTNKDMPRASMVFFFAPDSDTVIGPVEELVDEEHPPLYRNYYFKEFVEEFLRQHGTKRRLKEAFLLQH